MMNFKKSILSVTAVLVTFLYLNNLPSQTTAPGPGAGRPRTTAPRAPGAERRGGTTAPQVKPKGIPLQTGQKGDVTGSKKKIYCLGEEPSSSGQNHVRGFVQALSSQEKGDFYCSLYQSFGQHYTLTTPQEIIKKYQNQLSGKIPATYEVLSSVEQCFGGAAKPFCTQYQTHLARDPTKQGALERKALEFSWKHGTKQSPFADNLDYLRGIGFLIDALHQELTAGGNK